MAKPVEYMLAPDGFQNQLKEKYTARKTSSGGKMKARTGNSHAGTKSKATQGTGHRRKSYFTHIHD